LFFKYFPRWGQLLTANSFATRLQTQSNPTTQRSGESVVEHELNGEGTKILATRPLCQRALPRITAAHHQPLSIIARVRSSGLVNFAHSSGLSSNSRNIDDLVGSGQ
jgi:hypothetical protein